MKPTLASLAIALIASLGLFGCRATRSGEPGETPRPLIVLAIDGAEWSVIEELWSLGKLPQLKSLADRGVYGTLKTGYGSKSPVVWTTIATGVEPATHGIEDFVVSTDAGDVPVASSDRKVPALWNMASTAGRRTAVLGWWASWPPESIDGIVVSDRAGRAPEGSATPDDWWEQTYPELDLPERDLFPPGPARQQDEVVRAVAKRIREEAFDLRLVYLRSVDTSSHAYWRYFRTERYPPLAEAEIARFAGRIPRAYEAVDHVLGELLQGRENEANVLLISDHGFYGMKRESRRVACDLDGVLNRLGFLERSGRRVDLDRTRVLTHRSPRGVATKLLRTPDGSALNREDDAREITPQGRALERELRSALDRVRYADDAPLFELRRPNVEEAAHGAELVVDVLQPDSSESVLIDGAPLERLVSIERLSGSHGGSTHGVLIAAGPDIDPAAELDGIHISDIAPTILYGIGLPVAGDFAGRAWTPEFRERFPLQAIATWGTREIGGASDGKSVPSAVDEELVEELRALGYL